MPSTYPGALDNIPANKSDNTVAAGDHAPHHNALADAVNAVQSALGANLANVVAAADARIAASNKVSSDVTGITGADQITNMVSLTQAEYDAITPNASTFYVIAE
jgi:hypothetical protein